MEYTYEDFIQKFQETHIRFRGSGDPVTVMGPGINRKTFIVENDEGIQTLLNYTPETISTLDFQPPMVGNFNYRGYCFRLYRTPARQWKVGLCRANHLVYNPLQQILFDYTPLYKPVWTNALVKAMYNREFPLTWFGLAKQLEDKKTRSVGLTKNLSVSKNPTASRLPILWYKHVPVGKLDGERPIVEDERYRQEVDDEFRRWRS